MRRAAALLLALNTSASLAGEPAGQEAGEGTYLYRSIPDPEFAEGSPFSLVVGKKLGQVARGSFSCAEEHEICLESVYEYTLEAAQTLAGPKVDPSQSIWYSVHGYTAGQPKMAFIVKQSQDGRVWAYEGRVVEDGEACFGPWASVLVEGLQGEMREDGAEGRQFCVSAR